MRVIFNPAESRVFPREKSLSRVPLVIADDVNPTDDVEIKILDDKILVESTGRNEEITSDTEWLFIGKTLGLYGADKNLKSVLEVIVCDDAIAVHIMKGAVTVHPDESKADDVILVASGMPEGSCPAPYLDTILWVDRDYLCSLFKCWGDMASEYPADYIYQLVASGFRKDTTSITLSKVSMADISYGKIAQKVQLKEEKKRRSQIKNVSAMFSSPEVSEPTYETFDTDDEEEDDEFFDY